MKLPQGTGEERAARAAAMEAGLRCAIDVPLSLAKHADSMWQWLVPLARVANINCKSDLQVGARCLETSILGAHDNVMINLSDVSDVEFRSETERQVKTLVATARRQCQSVLDILDERQR